MYNNDQTEIARVESRHGIWFEDVVYGEYIDLQCLYANGWTLVIPLHIEEKECHEIFLSPPYGGNTYVRTYCKLTAHDSADPAQDPFAMAGLLTRHSDVLGFRLDMSRAEIEAAIDQSGGSGVERDRDRIRAERNDARKVSVQFAPNGRFYHRLQRRFGMASELRFPNWTGVWKGADGATFEIDAYTGGPGKPRVGFIDVAAPQQVRLIDAAVK